jgi:hypothetical protein
MELAHAGWPQRALLALEPEQRLEHEPRDPRLERVPDNLCTGSLRPALSHCPGHYHRGWADGRDFRSGRAFYKTVLPLGPDYGGPLFLSQYSFLGLDPRGLSDRYADYWQQCVAHTLINCEHCVRNPNGFEGYGPDCWGPDRE